ncbi:MAG TPA: FKBP-type peptidyl-prolyl cis-trans isomerase [Gemmatimonadales bacterium]|nr:FKBP-type peptidyl-prolyl cis-trans isomerase [Gemmatimonadales bacterium]
MKRLALLAGVLAVAGCKQQNAGPAKLASRTDSVSYIIGVQMGKSLKEQSVPVTADALFNGFRDGQAGATPRIADAQAQATMTAFRDEMLEKQRTKDSAAGSVNEKAGTDFLAANKSKPGVTTTASGVQYTMIKTGAGPKPKGTDVVTVHYKGALLNGEAFDSSYGHDPVNFPLNGLIPGLSEAIQLMPVGSKIHCWIPGNLAYGPAGSPPKIGPNETLAFDLELIAIKGK